MAEKTEIHPYTWIFMGFFTLVFLVMCGSSDDEPDSPHKVSAETATPAKEPIIEADLSPYTVEAGFARTIEKFGARRDDIQTFRKLAAEKAGSSSGCDVVEMSELSFDKSSTDNLSFFVNCRNGANFRFRESELLSSGPAFSEASKAVNESDAKMMCSDAIKATALHRSSVDISFLTGTATTKHQNGAVTVMMDYSEMSSVGTTVPMMAKCLIPVGQPLEITKSPR